MKPAKNRIKNASVNHLQPQAYGQAPGGGGGGGIICGPPKPIPGGGGGGGIM